MSGIVLLSAEDSEHDYDLVGKDYVPTDRSINAYELFFQFLHQGEVARAHRVIEFIDFFPISAN